MFQVSVLLILLMFIFASYGVQLFGGRLAQCTDHNIVNKVRTKSWSENYNNKTNNFSLSNTVEKNKQVKLPLISKKINSNQHVKSLQQMYQYYFMFATYITVRIVSSIFPWYVVFCKIICSLTVMACSWDLSLWQN